MHSPDSTSSPASATAALPLAPSLRPESLLAAYRLVPFRTLRVGTAFWHPFAPTALCTKTEQGRYADAEGRAWATGGSTMVVPAGHAA